MHVCSLNFSDPTLLSLDNKTFDPDYDVYRYNYDNKWGKPAASLSVPTLIS